MSDIIRDNRIVDWSYDSYDVLKVEIRTWPIDGNKAQGTGDALSMMRTYQRTFTTEVMDFSL